MWGSSPIIEDEPQDTKLLWKRKVSDLLRERRRAEIFCVEGVEPISSEVSNFHILPNCLLDLVVKPFPQVTIVLRLLAQLLRFFIQVDAAPVFVINSVASLIVQNVP